MKFIPQYERGYGRVYDEKFQRAVQKHMQLTAFGIRSFTTDDFEHLDSRNESLPDSPSLRTLLLNLKTRPASSTTTQPPPAATTPTPSPTTTSTPTPQPLFLAIDPATKHADLGSYVVTYMIANASDAEERLRHLLPYLSKDHGDETCYWFSAMAIECTKEVKWDEVNQWPISIEEMDLDALLDDDDVDWINGMDAAQISFAPAVAEELALPSRAHHVSNNPLAGDTDSVVTFYQASDLPATDGDSGNHCNAEVGMHQGAEGSPQLSADAV
jgi:hypothetical protein